MMVSAVAPEHINAVWLDVIPLVRKFVPHAMGRTNELAMYRELIAKQALLWIAFEEDNANKVIAFVITKFQTYPKGKLLSYEFLGGEDHRLGDWFPMMTDFTERFAKESGCVGVESVGRIGWNKVLKKMGWTPAFTIFERMFDKADSFGEEALEEDHG